MEDLNFEFNKVKVLWEGYAEPGYDTKPIASRIYCPCCWEMPS